MANIYRINSEHFRFSDLSKGPSATSVLKFLVLLVLAPNSSCTVSICRDCTWSHRDPTRIYQVTSRKMVQQISIHISPCTSISLSCISQKIPCVPVQRSSPVVPGRPRVVPGSSLRQPQGKDLKLMNRSPELDCPKAQDLHRVVDEQIYGHGSKPMVPYLGAWTSIYHLFWCSLGHTI